MTSHRETIATAMSATELLIADLQEQGIDQLAVATAMLLSARDITQRIDPNTDKFRQWRIEVVS